MSSEDFYQQLRPFQRFQEMTREVHFHPLPDDWVIVIADVVNSTGAIAEGKYKDVNTIGAACIVAVKNAMATLDFPFVFGGDGATLLIPQNQLAAIGDNLLALQALAQEGFDLELRIGVVPIREIRARGREVSVAKFELVPGAHIAFMRGGGVTEADALIKAPGGQYRLTGTAVYSPDLSGLSCRWQAIPNRNGTVLSLLLQVRDSSTGSSYTELLDSLRDLFGGELESLNPVNSEFMSYKPVRECRTEERRLHPGRLSWGWLKRLAEIVAAVAIFRHGLAPLIFKPSAYRRSLGPHSDYRKFDDMLRMVIDCSHEQAEQLEAQLNRWQAAGKIHFGLHQSVACRITCFFENANDGGHLHFVDGDNGGYAAAARKLKAQINAAQ